MKKDYQMTTVCNYVKLLDEELSPKSKQIEYAAEQYLAKMRQSRKANSNANLLELLLA